REGPRFFPFAFESRGLFDELFSDLWFQFSADRPRRQGLPVRCDGKAGSAVFVERYRTRDRGPFAPMSANGEGRAFNVGAFLPIERPPEGPASAGPIRSDLWAERFRP